MTGGTAEGAVRELRAAGRLADAADPVPRHERLNGHAFIKQCGKERHQVPDLAHLIAAPVPRERHRADLISGHRPSSPRHPDTIRALADTPAMITRTGLTVNDRPAVLGGQARVAA